MMLTKALGVFLAAAMLCTLTSALPEFIDEIPNGMRVPNPCGSSNVPFFTVGHQDMSGGGALNAFGQDFLDAGNKRSEELCRKDSNGDGRTNGQELGDPKRFDDNNLQC
ncbi:temptin-like isoform X2 [Aplysia californica]|uniref:Temptin-like isoform X2 n=1 Tax=Aplysia californica TaxID=6500 RepID=A0ABM1A4B0_APLCA|nr:temptin-like isoform X2 [Aplysia californica]